MKKMKLCLIAVVLVLIGSPAAHAGEGWIAGVSAGASKLQHFRLPTDKFDDNTIVWTAFGGYQFLKCFGVVGGYLNLGEYEAEGPSFGGYEHKMEIDGLYARGLGILPVSSRVSLIGSLGVFRWNYDFNGSDPSDPRRHLSDTGYSPTLGLGVDVDLAAANPHFRGLNFHAGLERLYTVGDRERVEHEGNIDMLLVGLNYNFTP